MPLTSLHERRLSRARRALKRRDPVLARLIERVGPCRLPPPSDPYRTLVRAVLYQQLAGSAAAAIERRLRERFGGRLPSPQRLAAAPAQTLRAVGLSRQKVATVRALAQAFARGELRRNRLVQLEDAEVVAEVTRIRGVGEWTAHMLLLFGLGRLDVLPVGDYGIRRGVQRLYGLREIPSREELTERAACWRPYRSVASWYIWRHERVGLPE